jgi:hypothetical protein
METVTYSQVHELVKQLSETKLAVAYDLLIALAKQNDDELLPQNNFLRLPADERYQLLAYQAEQMKAHYEETADERDEWQTGEFMNEY